MKTNFLQNMVEDRTESALSYYEFLLHIQQQVNKWRLLDLVISKESRDNVEHLKMCSALLSY